jgi:hypothetical protein
MRKLLVKSTLRLAACLLVLPSCAWLSSMRLGATPTPINLAIPSNPIQTTSPQTTLPVKATPEAALLQSPGETLAPAPIGITAPVFDQTAIKHLIALSEMIGPREAGTANESKAAQYIEAALKELGYQTCLQPFGFPGDDDTIQYSANVIGIKAGQSTKAIIVGAHYDSVAIGRGADDNASGVAVMLEVAEMIKALPTPYTIRFVAFGAEEMGLSGSSYYVKKMSAADIQNTISMINLDSLIAGNTPNVYGNSQPKGALLDWFLEFAKSRDLDLQTQPVKNLDYPDGSPCDCADYSAFQAAGIPFAFFEATDWNLGDQDGWTQVDPKFGKHGEIWNTKYDYLDYINQNFPGRIEQHLNLFVTLLYSGLTQFK